MSKPLVSIIIPVYNGSKYVGEAIDSALEQTYENIEIIVINDGSKDKGKTKAIAESYGAKIRYYEKENGGVSSALNCAIKKAKGQFISWVSHDDKILPNKIELQIEYLIKNNLLNEKIVLYSDHNLINKNSKYIETCNKRHDEFNEKSDLALLNGKINGITMLIPKSCFDDCGYFDENLVAVQDYEMWQRILKKYKIIHMPLVLSESRYHSKQVTNVSPKVITEGNPFWINLVKSISEKRQKELYGSTYNYYKNMYNFFKETPYKQAQEFCQTEQEKIETNTKIDLINNKVSIILLDNSLNTSELKKQSYKNIEIIKYDDITNATGDYFIFIDNCNNLNIDRIKEQLSFMKLNNANISVTNVNEKDLLKNLVNKKVLLSTIMIKKEIFTKEIINSTNVYLLDQYKNDYIFCLDKQLVTNNNITETDLDNYIYYKELLKYVLNDKFYEKNDYIISIIINKYTYYANLVKRIDEYNKCTKYSLIKHIKKSIIMDGFIKTALKILKK